MIKEFEPITEGVLNLMIEWEPKLLELNNDLITSIAFIK